MTPPRLRVALIGKSGAGKSQVAGLLTHFTGAEVVKTGAVCREVSRLLFGNESKRSTQMLDDALTTIDESIFLRAALRGRALEESVVIDALRFHSDVKLAKSLGFTLLRVRAPDHVRVARLRARGQDFELAADGQHRSELELDGIAVDREILNDTADPAHLSQLVEAFLGLNQ